eukprot:CAMPEP_0202351500 /NCGR_PEP_ID=MMETSP1126-20121109/8111_1 /ASSEMBLY_ACC=CAM_ASM_000457 /TAXON_ID=3047 /ORGANISM="Dunaliella tertiolecta, Strain CCMP1320" /LENGTH=933 /DNA_ID=CAMNT_0048943611 /DNA_START=36 /DNA_END=2838 /DNA_ORIENTATION=+
MDDFNPNFSFSFGSEPGTASKPQAAWEFAGALKQAKAEQNRTNAHSTSLDQKIKRRLQTNADMKGWKAEDKQKKREQRKASKRGGSNNASGAKESSEEDSDDEDDDDSDEPLPGELDDEDSDEDEGEEEDEEDAGPSGEDDDEGEEEDEEEEQEDPRVKAKQQQQRRQQEQQRLLQQKQQRAQLAGSKRRQEEQQEENGHGVQGPGVTSTDDGEDGESSSEGEEEEAAQEPQQKKSKQQQQQKGVQEKHKNESQANGNAASERQQPGASTSGKGGEASGGSAKGQKGGFFARTPDGTTFTATSFADLQLSRPLLKAITGLGYTTPTPIQAAVVPLALAGRDVCGSAITGSGKTAAFALPCLERLLHRPRQIAATYVLVLTPTRELAVQVHSMITTLAQHTDISAALVVGGLSSQVQASVLRRSPEIVVATPGRLIDHLHNTQSVGLEDLAVLVLDEADRLLEMGFKEEVTEILRMAPKKRQTMLFSATFNDEVRASALAADAAAAVPKELRQEVVRLKGAAAAHKEAVLLAMCARSFRGAPSIIFFRTKQRAHRLKILFGLLGLPVAAELHGDMTQAARLESLEMFRTKEASFLLATDVAARGLDISGVQVVINYDTPRTLETYLHRIGRTARAGAAGVAVTFVEDSDRNLLREVVRRTKANVCQRLVPAASVVQWQSKLEAAEEDVAQVISEERYERELRKAEMEANKTQNMIDHSSEIHSRPARSWFQTERQKKEIAQRAGRAAAGLPPLPGDADSEDGEDAKAAPEGPSKQEKKNKKKERLKQEAAEKKASAKKENSLMEETGEHTRQIRSAKSKIRSLREQGMTAAAAAKAVAAAAAPKSAKKKKQQQQQHGAGGGESSLFSGDGTGRPAAGGTAKAKSKEDAGKDLGAHTNKRSDRTGFSSAQLNRVKRGGVGKKAFKSKKKYQRKKK